MIEKVLDAYEAKITGKSTFIEKLSRMDWLTKVLFWGVIISAIIILGLALFIQSQTIVIILVLYVGFVYICTLTLEKTRHRKWETNLKGYNEELNIIAEILKEEDFNLYEKNKIKQLICKYYQSIDIYETMNEKKNSDIKEFVCTYIVPVIAFLLEK